MKQEYPKFIYHKSFEPKIVRSEEEHKKHSDWAEAPVALEKEEPKAPLKKPKLKKAE